MIISISNQKGGVGKTTTAINLSGCLVRMGHSVLIVDLDPQANLSSSYRVEDNQKNIYAAMVGDIPVRNVVIKLEENASTESKGQLSIIPGSHNFSRYEKFRAGEANCQFDLKKALAVVKNEFDYIILDTPPALGLITVNALPCSDYVLIPVEAQLFSLEGLEKLNKTINEIKEMTNPTIKIGGIFFIRHDKRKILNKEVENFIKETYKENLLENSIRESVAIRESPHEGKDIFSYAPHSNGAKDYESLTKELIKKICKEKR